MSTGCAIQTGKGILLGIVYISLALLCFNIFIPISDPIMTYDAKRFFSLSLVSIFCLLILIFPSIRTFIINQISSLSFPVKIAVLTLFLTIFISDLFNSNSVLSSFIYDFYHLGIIFLSFLFLSYYLKDRGSYFFLCSLLTICLFLSVAVAFYYRTKLGLDTSNRTILSFVNPRFLNQVHIWMIIPVCYLYMIAKLRNKHALTVVYGILLVFSYSLVFTLDSRGVFISTLGGFILVLILDRKHRLLWGKVFAFTIVGGGIISLIMFKYIPMWLLGESFIYPEVRTRTSDRLSLWENTLSSSRLFGNGGGSYVCDGFAFGHPHNSLLDIIYHWGGLAAILYSVLCLMLLYKVCKTDSPVTRILGVSLLVGLAYSLLSGVLTMPLSQIMAVISLSVFWACYKNPISAIIPSKTNNFTLLGIALAMILSSSYIIYSRVEFYSSRDSQEQSYSNNLTPQIWLGGNCLK